MSSYYPDGVSGSEYAMGGGGETEGSRWVECSNDECELFEIQQEQFMTIWFDRTSEWSTFKCWSCGEEGRYEQER